MKTKEELDAIKEEVETVNKKLYELNDEELEQVTGGKSEEHQEPEYTSEIEFPVKMDEPVK